ncbi:MAG TPA: DUF2268 domain-containing putative Zn-dependent protease [Vicinamibacterales bacterium]|nr:DUF2268 domain-containing putative Zn-dependent protease [Vicinamibacterales bacterium]
MLVRYLATVLLLTPYASCGAPRSTDVVFYVVDGYRFSWADRRAIERIADTTAVEVGKVLPALPARVTLRVRAGKDVIVETGETGEVHPPDVVYWTLDPGRREGVTALVTTRLRPSLVHHFHHLVREATVGSSHTLMEEAIAEGLATVFERDFAGATAPWGAYPANVDAWVTEFRSLPRDAPHDRWMVRHPDGRRWIGYKVGTYLVDRAMKASGRSAAALVSVPTDDILRMADNH